MVSMYPHALRHLQQIVMDCERCANSRGKKTFFGADKLEKANDKLVETLMKTQDALALDIPPDRVSDVPKALDEINTGLQLLKSTYPNWPSAFEYWDFWYPEARKLLNKS